MCYYIELLCSWLFDLFFATYIKRIHTFWERQRWKETDKINVLNISYLKISTSSCVANEKTSFTPERNDAGKNEIWLLLLACPVLLDTLMSLLLDTEKVELGCRTRKIQTLNQIQIFPFLIITKNSLCSMYNMITF